MNEDHYPFKANGQNRSLEEKWNVRKKERKKNKREQLLARRKTIESEQKEKKRARYICGMIESEEYEHVH